MKSNNKHHLLKQFKIKNLCKSNTMRMLFIYFSIVLLFAVIDYFVFRCDTSAFIVSEQFNKKVARLEFDDNKFDVNAYHRRVKDVMPISINDYCIMMSPYYDSLDSLNTIIKNDVIKYVSLQKDIDSIVNQMNIFCDDSIQQFVAKELSDCSHRIDSMKKQWKVWILQN